MKERLCLKKGTKVLYITDNTGKTVTLPADREKTLTQVIHLSGLFPPQALCSGIGRCGRCTVHFLENPPPVTAGEEEILGKEVTEKGGRLGCRHRALSGTRASLDIPLKQSRTKYYDSGPVALAVDLGTTSIHWQAFDLKGRCVAKGKDLNPQLGAGSDVMARLAYAATPKGAYTLKQIICSYLKNVAEQFEAVDKFVLAGNPAMTLLALGLPTTGIATAPYRLNFTGNVFFDFGLSSLPKAYIPPQLCPFVGGDLSAGITALATEGANYPFLLADMGTNGEFILAVNKDTFFAVSVPLGPALEGAGLTCGNVAGPGSVTSFSLSPAGLISEHIAGACPGKKAGITGAGYISLLALLRSCNVVLTDGSFAGQGTTPLANRLLKKLYKNDFQQNCLPLGNGLLLSAGDIEELLKVKAAFAFACSYLLSTAGLENKDLQTVYLAGSLGEHIEKEHLETLGFLSSALAKKVKIVGNASLAGAVALMTDKKAKTFIPFLLEKTHCLDLAGSADFTQHFVRYMTFEYAGESSAYR